MCWLSWNLDASTFWNRQGLSKPVMGLLFTMVTRASSLHYFVYRIVLTVSSFVYDVIFTRFFPYLTIFREIILIPCWYFFSPWRCGPTRAMATSFLRFLYHTQRHATVGRTTLDEWPGRRSYLYPDDTQHSQHTNIHTPSEIQNHWLGRRTAADPRLRSHDHRDRLVGSSAGVIFMLYGT